MTFQIVATICAGFVALLVFAEYRPNDRLRWIAKPAASLAFVLTALTAGATESAYGLWILAGLVFCMAGDVLLILSGEKAFLAGMGAFALGHAAYIGAFLSGGPVVTPAFLAGAAAMTVFAGASLRWLWPHLGRFRWPVTGYTAIIAGMVATSFLVDPPPLAPPSLHVVFAAAAFAVSDLSVARDKFVAPEFLNRAWGLPLYYGAQLMLAASV